MNLERFRKHCMSLPGATEQIQWGADLVFKVGGKMFAVAATEAEASHRLSFKCSDESFAELVEQEGVVPAPYLARAKWVALERFDSLGDKELESRIVDAYTIIFQKLSKPQQAAIGGGGKNSKATGKKAGRKPAKPARKARAKSATASRKRRSARSR